MGDFSSPYSWLFWAALLFFFGMRHPAIFDPQSAGPIAHAGWRSRRWSILILSFTRGSGAEIAPVKISATIITYNEERNLPRAIESLRCADEIMVVDSGSTDRTVEIAEKLGARVVESPWPGYAKQKNFAAENAVARLDSFARRRRIAERGAGRRDLAAQEKRSASSTPIRCRAWRNIWGAGSTIRAGIRIARCGCTTAARRAG